MTASVVASELGLPLFAVQADCLITKYLGETSVRLRQVFETISGNRAVCLFDEFDAIGADRGLDNEVGEMRRILSSFLQFVEADASVSVIIVATNDRTLLDRALFRRFDEVVHYGLPTKEQARRIAEIRTGPYDRGLSVGDEAAAELSRLCQADIARICGDAVKESLLDDAPLSEGQLPRLCGERLSAYGGEG